MGIFQELLLKAKRDLTKLVQVQRMVAKNGKTFTQTFYVDPNQVKPTDRVIGGQQNLLPSMQSIKKPATGVYDQTYFNTLFNHDKKKALEYLKECGVVWTDSSNFGINVMRAKMAMKKKFGAVSPQTKPATQAPKHTIQQAATNAGAQVVLTPDQQKELNSYSTGREKVVVLKKLLGQDGCLQYAKQMGVTWTESSHKGINLMQMSMALTKYFDSSLGNVPTAQNAVAPKPTPASNEPKVDESQIDVSKLKGREKAIAELLNKCDDTTLLTAFSEVGMVGEDQQASDYIKNTLHRAYFISDNGNGLDLKVNSIFDKKLPKSGLDNFVYKYHDPIFGGWGLKDVILPEMSYRFGGLSFTSSWNATSGLYVALSRLNSFDTRPSTFEERLTYKFNGSGLHNALQHISKHNPDLKPETDRISSELEQALACIKGNEYLFECLIGGSFPDLQKKFDSIDPEFWDPKSDGSRVILNETTLSNFESDLKSILKEENITIDEFVKHVLTNNEAMSVRPDGHQWGYKAGEDDGHSLLVSFKKLTTSKNNFKLKSYESPYAPSLVRRFLFAYVEKKNFGKSIDDLYELTVKKVEDSDAEYKLARNLDIDSFRIQSLMESLNKDKYLNAAQRELSSLKREDVVEAYKHILKAFNKRIYDNNKNDITDTIDFNYLSNTLLDRYSTAHFVGISTSDPKTNAVVANLNYISNLGKTLSGISTAIRLDSKVKTPVSEKFNFMVETANERFKDPNSGEITVRTSLGDIKESEYNKAVLEQLDKIPTISSASFEELRKTFLGDSYKVTDPHQSIEEAYDKMKKSDFNPKNCYFQNSSFEMKKLIRDTIQATASYTVGLKKKGRDTPEKIAEFVDNELGFDINEKDVTKNLTGEQLRKLREDALKKNNCSLKSIVDSEFKNIEHETKVNWDKGTKVFKDRSVIVHGAYEIRNASWFETFEKASASLKEDIPNSAKANRFYDNKVKRLYHGTNQRGGAGILGVSGKFLVKGHGNKTAGAMLGRGVYLADMAGKSGGYFNATGWGMGHGCLLVCDTVLGNHHTCDDYHSVEDDYSVNSVSMVAGGSMNSTKLKADEWCVRDPNLVCPRTLIDAESITRK